MSRWLLSNTQEWAKPKAGDVFVWVGQLGQIQIPWKSLQARGVFTVYYQTEPREGCDLHGPDGIDEVWDYSWHNIEVIKCQKPKSLGLTSTAGKIPRSVYMRSHGWGGAGAHAGVKFRGDSLARR